MIEKQEIILIKKEELVSKVAELAAQNYRLVQICATRTDRLTLDYSFDDTNNKFINFRFELQLEGAELPTITGVYLAAFTYENELHDLFGITIPNIAIDFGGKFYRINEKQPFNPAKQEG